MPSLSSETTQQKLLQLLNAEMRTNYSSFEEALRVFESGTLPAINVCGFRCDGSCATCDQAEANLSEFFGAAKGVAEAEAELAEPVDLRVMAFGGDETNEEMDEEMRMARAMDEMEEIQRANAWEYDDRYSYNGYDEGYGLDWNDSGYFD
jgi:hypothetical protein